VFSYDCGFGFGFCFGQAGWLLGVVALETDDVVVAQEGSLAVEALVAFVARETVAVPVKTFERHVKGVFRFTTCTDHAYNQWLK